MVSKQWIRLFNNWVMLKCRVSRWEFSTYIIMIIIFSGKKKNIEAGWRELLQIWNRHVLQQGWVASHKFHPLFRINFSISFEICILKCLCKYKGKICLIISSWDRSGHFTINCANHTLLTIASMMSSDRIKSDSFSSAKIISLTFHQMDFKTTSVNQYLDISCVYNY